MPTYNDPKGETRQMMTLNLLSGKTPAGTIEASEAKGQKDLVASADLSIDQGRGQLSLDGISKRTGVVFGDKINDLFVSAQLPTGWKKEATDHSMWSKLVDEKGRERAGIFYKAAFYDRSAHMRWKQYYRTRYKTIDAQGRESYVDDDFDPATAVEVHYAENGDGETVFDVDAVQSYRSIDSDDREASQRCFTESEKASQACAEWLDQNRPEWRDVFAYWDEHEKTP